MVLDSAVFKTIDKASSINTRDNKIEIFKSEFQLQWEDCKQANNLVIHDSYHKILFNIISKCAQKRVSVIRIAGFTMDTTKKHFIKS